MLNMSGANIKASRMSITVAFIFRCFEDCADHQPHEPKRTQDDGAPWCVGVVLAEEHSGTNHTDEEQQDYPLNQWASSSLLCHWSRGHVLSDFTNGQIGNRESGRSVSGVDRAT